MLQSFPNHWYRTTFVLLSQRRTFQYQQGGDNKSNYNSQNENHFPILEKTTPKYKGVVPL